MNLARILVLMVAGVAAAFVWMFVRNSSANTPPPAEIAADASTVQVLVAARDLDLGRRVTPDDLRWSPWPGEGVSERFYSDADHPQAIETLSGSIVRDTLGEGEPIVARKLVEPGETGFMAAILAPGFRAVSTEITAETAAGGFILPGDRVDVIISYETEGGDGDSVATSRTILENTRVLAIDQSPERDDDDQVHVGQTATLELTPPEAELLTLAQALGDITLVLRSVADIDMDAALLDGAGRDARRAFGGISDDALVIYRYGARSAAPIGGGP